MFNWTMDRVLNAVAAGIAEVTAIYNHGYLAGIIAVGPAGGRAHDFAARWTQNMLVNAETNRYERAVETMLETLGITIGAEYEVSDQGDGTPMRYFDHNIEDHGSAIAY